MVNPDIVTVNLTVLHVVGQSAIDVHDGSLPPERAKTLQQQM